MATMFSNSHNKIRRFIEAANEVAQQCGIAVRFEPYVYGDGVLILSSERRHEGQIDLDRFLIELTHMADSDNLSLQLALTHNDLHIKNAYSRFGFHVVNDTDHLEMERQPHRPIEMRDHEFEPQMESAPPGKKAERFIKKHKKDFKKRYGDRWQQVLYATAWKQFGESTQPSFKDYVTLVEALNEAATKVRVLDKKTDRPYYYWVTVKNPEKAKAAALQKHRKAMGGQTIIPDSDLEASIPEN